MFCRYSKCSVRRIALLALVGAQGPPTLSDVLEDMETAEVEESEDGDDPRVKCTRYVHSRLDFSQAPWPIMA